MNKYQKAFIERPAHYLMHYNHNHDKLGRFARSNGSGGSDFKFTRKDRQSASEAYRKENPKNKGMSPIDHVYDAINKRDYVKSAEKRKRAYSEVSSQAAKELASILRKNDVDEMNWRDAYERGYYGDTGLRDGNYTDTQRKYQQIERQYREKYRADIERVCKNLYDMKYKSEISPTNNKSVNDIIDEDVHYIYSDAVASNIYEPVSRKHKNGK